MIEKRTLWLVTPYLNIHSTTALYDTERQQVLSYVYADEEDYNYASPEDKDRFFETREQADEYIEVHQAELKAMMPRVKSFLDEMNDIEPTDDFQFEKSDYLPGNLIPSCGYYQKENRRLDQIIDILQVAIQQQMLCINGNTIPLAHIGRIAWYDEKAEIFYGKSSIGLYNSVYTCCSAEFSAIRILFGRNISNRVCSPK